jgi:SAP domain
MLRFLFGFKWQKSKAHLLLLSEFLRPHTIEDYENLSVLPWKKVLGETPSRAIKRFLREGVLKHADTAKSLEWKYKVPELKKMLKERNLPVSGNKGDLILRLIETDPTGVEEDVSGLNVLLCSELGRRIVDGYLTVEKEKGLNVERQVLEALQNRKFKEASLACSSFEAEQVFQGGVGTLSRDTTRDIAILKEIFDGNPKILKNLNNEWLVHLRLAAGMMYLWGTRAARGWLPSDWETGLAMNGDTAARMIMFYAINQVNLAQYREWGAKVVDISIAGPSSCNACKKLAKKKFRIDEVIELPYEGCTSETGCRCMVQLFGW